MSKTESSKTLAAIDHLDIWSGAWQKKAGTGRGRNGKLTPYGIQKLRELILELAVRGRLVPQDPNDEPASVLLEKIAEEMARLVKVGKIRKQKKLPEINEEQKPFGLPEGWAWARLGELTPYGASEKAEAADVSEDTWVLELEDIEKTTSALLKRVRFSDRKFKSTKNRFSAGDVLYGKLRPYLDKVLVADEDGVCTTEIIPIKVLGGLDSWFLRLLLKSPDFIRYANESTHGMNLPRLGTDKARLALLPVPPLAEQHRIVDKVDELMALCDRLEQEQTDSLEAHQTLVETLLRTLTDAPDAEAAQQAWTRIAQHFDTLFTTEHSIDQLKQTILQLAVMGKLVPQDPNDEPASVLLERIAKEKTRLVKEGKIKKQKKLPDIMEGEKPFELPTGWEWTRLGDLSLQSEAGWSPKCLTHPREGDGWAVLKVSAVTWGKFNPNENKALPANLSPRSEYEVHPGDFLISRANTAELVAKAVVVPDGAPKKLMMSDKIIRLVFPDEIDHGYLSLANGSPYARKYYLQVAGGTSSSMKNVSREQIRRLVVGVPPLAEQHRIVAKVDELMALCDALKVRIQETEDTRVRLADAVAARAVAG